MPQDAARQSEAAPPAAERRHAQDKIAALEDKIADMIAQLEAAQRRELWLQSYDGGYPDPELPSS